MAAFWTNLTGKSLGIVGKTILCLFGVAAFFFALALILQGLLITIPAVGFVTLPFSNNYNGLLQGAFNGLGFIGNSWQNLATQINPYALCLDSLFISWNKIARFVVAVMGSIANIFSITYPSWWTSRGFDHVRDFQLALHHRMLEIEQLKQRIIQSELATKGYRTLEEADAYTKIHALHAGNVAASKEFKRSFQQVVPQIICTLINGVSDILIDLIDMFSPFFLVFLDLLLTAIKNGQSGNLDEFALLLVKFLFSQILRFLASIGLDIGQCLLDIPNSLILCIFPTCHYHDISDVGALIFGCAFSPICTVDQSTVSNAGDVLFQCLKIQSIIDFGLSIYRGILSLQGIVTYLQSFFTTIYNGILSLRVVVDFAYDLLKKVANRFGVSVRGMEIHVDDPHMVLDRIVMILGFERPYMTTKIEIDVLHDIYTIVGSVNATDIRNATAHNYEPQLSQMRALISGNMTHHQHPLAPHIVWREVAKNIEKYYSDKMKAFIEASRQMQEVMHLSVHDPVYIDRKLQLDRILNPEGIKFNVFGDYNASFVKPITFDNSNLHAAAEIVKNLAHVFNSTVHSPILNRSFGSAAPMHQQSPIWMREDNFRDQLNMFMDMHNHTHHNNTMFKTVNMYRSILSDDTHYRQIQLLGNAVRNFTHIFHWVFSQDHHQVTVPMIRSKLRDIPMVQVVAGLRHVASTVRKHMGITVSPERAARTKMWIARWIDSDVHHEMQRGLIEQGFDMKTIATEAKATEDRYFATMRDVIEKRKNVHNYYEYYDNNRFALIASITGTSLGGTLLYGGVPFTIVASLLPAVGALALPAVGLVVGFLPQVIGYLMQKATNLITNFFNAGEYIAPDIITNLLVRLGPSILDMYNFQPSPFLISAMFGQTIELANDIIDDVGQYAIYAIACNVPPVPLVQCPAWPSKDDTANSYFMKLVFFPMDELCYDDTQCPSGFCRRAVDVNDLNGCYRYCTVDEPCNPPGVCINPPLLPTGNCMRPGFFNVTFNVDCTTAGYTTKIYQQSNSFKTYGLSWNFVFSNAGVYFLGQCMLDNLVAIRAVLRLVVHGYSIPAQGLFSGLLTNIPFVPSIVGGLYKLTVFYYFIAPRLQSAVVATFPTLTWMDKHLWAINWFGLRSPFLGIMGLFRYDDYAQNPPLGSPTPADNMCPLLNISYVFIGGILNLFVLVIAIALLMSGAIGILIDLFFLIIFPLLYLWHVSKVANHARQLHQRGILSYEMPAQQNPVMEWHMVNNEIIGAPRARERFNIGAIWPSVKHALTNSNFANDILMDKPMYYSKYIIDPKECIPIRHSKLVQIVRKAA